MRCDNLVPAAAEATRSAANILERVGSHKEFRAPAICAAIVWSLLNQKFQLRTLFKLYNFIMTFFYFFNKPKLTFL